MSDAPFSKTPHNPDLSDVEPAVQAHVLKVRNSGTASPSPDWIASEAPLEVRIGGIPTTVLMRTPGHDEELVRGFLYGEGVVTAAEEVLSIGPVHSSPEDVGGSVINVQLAPTRKGRALDREFYSNASCGVCGKKTIESLEVKGTIAKSRLTVSGSLLRRLPDRLRDAQTTFARTGGVHASGLFTADGDLVALREDVGRHNALDKIIGWALAEGRLPLTNYLLLVSGRVSYEIVQKAVVAGIPFIAAVGAPSSLAVDLAARFDLTLVGFLKPDSMNIYTHPERVS
ncbi:MAG TPA: formate dehydrogenase accessory sulfurtransferase FdhD [Terriglobia bacterium]|nr:formate dehydrogenase accessory sulfurtransferase FdhD [Terriglobia bacterium]